jgi:two-component system chemotaxis response regulator CheB
MIRVLIAEGSPFQANFLSRALKHSGVAESVGVARNGEEAILLAHRLKPDVILMDAGLPVLRAALATRQIMEHAPSRILITAEPSSHDQDLAFIALDEGAVDLVARASPPAEENARGLTRLLVKRIELAARSCLTTSTRSRPVPFASQKPTRQSPPLVLMGGAVGGIQATTEILRRLPTSFSGSICLVQHLAPGFLLGYARWLAGATGFRVEVCRQERKLAPRTLYLAPEEAHLVLDSPESVAPQRGRTVGGHRPSVTALFRSAAAIRPATSCAVILSGEGRDGVEGVKLLAREGGSVLVQKRETCLVAEMPKHALRAHAGSLELSPAETARVLGDPHPASGDVDSGRALFDARQRGRGHKE